MAFEVQHQVDLPEGELLKARLVELESKEIPKKDPKPGEASSFTKLVWKFEVTEQGDYNGKQVRVETSAFLSDSPHNQFGNFARALLRGELPVGTVLSEEDLVGLSCFIEIAYVPDRLDKSKKWPRVAECYPLDPASINDEPPF